MEITISIPDNFIPATAVNENIPRQVLEAYAIENYRLEKISIGKLREILDLSVDEANILLKEHKVPVEYTLEDLAEDSRTVEMFLKKLK
jgi:predicted HTH domain antitoxin